MKITTLRFGTKEELFHMKDCIEALGLYYYMETTLYPVEDIVLFYNNLLDINNLLALRDATA